MSILTPDFVKEHGCELLGDVHGVSGLYGAFAAKGLNKSRTAAMNQARQMGANAILWASFNNVHGSTSVDGYAYKCPPRTL